MLYPLESIIKGYIIAVSYGSGDFLHQNEWIGQHGVRDIHLGAEYMVVESDARFPSDQR